MTTAGTTRSQQEKDGLHHQPSGRQRQQRRFVHFYHQQIQRKSIVSRFLGHLVRSMPYGKTRRWPPMKEELKDKDIYICTSPVKPPLEDLENMIPTSTANISV